MSLRVHNTLTDRKEIFLPVRPGKVGMYLCGPTVYKTPHIGHMVGPVIFDAIKRYLQFKGFEVTWVVNITDVDDKLIDAARAAGVSMQAVAERHTREYVDCLQRFGIDAIDLMPRASEHIVEIHAMIRRLIDAGHAYAADGNVWFDVASDADYGKLSHRRMEDQEANLRQLDGAGKRHPADFALWKAAKPGEPSWDSPWGPGRPGWHIECSAMSTKYLGETFDIHGGGMDLLFPHHENELAQSESATGKPFARYWLHNGLTRARTKNTAGELKQQKISGSDLSRPENAQIAARLSAAALLDEHGAELLRYLLLGTHYRRPIEFTDDVLVASRKGLGTFQRLFERVERLGIDLEGTPDLSEVSGDLLEGESESFVRASLGLKMKFLEAMDDDFNTAGAIGVMHELAGQINAFVETLRIERERPQRPTAAAASAARMLRNLGQILGLFRAGGAPPAPASDLSQQLMGLLIELRAAARQRRDFATADAVRDGLARLGVTLEDRPDGTLWRKA